jgi:hypothetical protein
MAPFATVSIRRRSANSISLQQMHSVLGVNSHPLPPCFHPLQAGFLFSSKQQKVSIKTLRATRAELYMSPPRSTAIYFGCHGNDKRQVTLISVSSPRPPLPSARTLMMQLYMIFFFTQRSSDVISPIPSCGSVSSFCLEATEVTERASDGNWKQPRLLNARGTGSRSNRGY